MWVCALAVAVLAAREGFAVALSDGGSGWSREEVDRIGCLRLLRDPSHYRVVGEAEEPDAEKRKKAQIAIEIAAEEAFLKLLGGSAAQQAALAKVPSYADHAGQLYNHLGECVSTPSDLQAWETDELLPLRCPHPPTCCKMATLIRQVFMQASRTHASLILSASLLPSPPHRPW